MLVEAAVAVEAPNVVVEQRSEPRYEDIIERAVITFRGQSYPVPVLNISSRGTQIECDIAPRLGESLVIQFENCSRLHGFVRWAREGKLGIRFGHELILDS
ncbi:MAG TPA: PilZ domain-containing protein [Allosphingosinicella sp.]|uniref:PilZ domain-containing protein n=1 Tax=Allosphingosinicella sp. TaxID=2823234 RepID=UPI002EDAF9A9